MYVCIINTSTNLIISKYSPDIIPLPQEGYVHVPLPEELCWECIKNEVTQDGDGNWIFEENLIQKEAIWNAIRVERNRLLTETDWTQLKDVNTDKDWPAYRQALRDITKGVTDPTKVVWPKAP
jgi:hypothetical protein